MAEKYILRITAGPDYDSAEKYEVPVNRPEAVQIKSDAADIELNVRIQNYQGLPRGSPSTSPYFDTPPHDYNQDQYSIAFRFTPHKPAASAGNSADNDDEDDAGISGINLQFGNDFDRPIRDKLPPGFNTALNIVKWWIDPGLDGDAYADRPYMFGPALSSFNTLHVGKGEHNDDKGGLWFDEGGDEDGMQARKEAGAPGTSKGRMKWALGAQAKEDWLFEYGKTYGMDLYNPYIDFTNLALRLPGFHLPIVRYWDGQGLRYVARANPRFPCPVFDALLFTLSFLFPGPTPDAHTSLDTFCGTKKPDRCTSWCSSRSFSERTSTRMDQSRKGPRNVQRSRWDMGRSMMMTTMRRGRSRRLGRSWGSRMERRSHRPAKTMSTEQLLQAFNG